MTDDDYKMIDRFDSFAAANSYAKAFAKRHKAEVRIYRRVCFWDVLVPSAIADEMQEWSEMVQDYQMALEEEEQQETMASHSGSTVVPGDHSYLVVHGD